MRGNPSVPFRKEKRRERARMGEVIVVTSGKGGTGKSSVSAGCAAALARAGNKVLLLDADAGLRSLDLMLGAVNDAVFDLGDVLAGNCEPVRAIREIERCEGLALMPAPQSLQALAAPDDMRRLCRGLANYYDYLFIDAPAGIGKGFQIAAAAAGRALVVITPDPVCMRSGERVARLLQQEGIADRRLVINRYRPGTLKLGLVEDLDAVIDAVGLQLIGVVPEDEQVQRYAANGEPLGGGSPAAKAMERLARRLMGQEVPLVVEK
ncbi:P-loop NTPase [Solibaculum intestinale]|uniref:P-loop NTPase n=1 Tax=Solibaculum intestinale TaxID=3133165 RepID=A0ABV1DXQ3_9FIRM